MLSFEDVALLKELTPMNSSPGGRGENQLYVKQLIVINSHLFYKIKQKQFSSVYDINTLLHCAPELFIVQSIPCGICLTGNKNVQIPMVAGKNVFYLHIFPVVLSLAVNFLQFFSS